MKKRSLLTLLLTVTLFLKDSPLQAEDYVNDNRPLEELPAGDAGPAGTLQAPSALELSKRSHSETITLQEDDENTPENPINIPLHAKCTIALQEDYDIFTTYRSRVGIWSGYRWTYSASDTSVDDYLSLRGQWVTNPIFDSRPIHSWDLIPKKAGEKITLSFKKEYSCSYSDDCTDQGPHSSLPSRPVIKTIYFTINIVDDV